jgi:hypothetical protein
MVISYSDIDPDGIEGLWTGEGNINENPGFIDDSCHISDTSQCHNSGTESIDIEGNTFFAPGNDFDGDERPAPYCYLVDIGADEIELDCVGVDEFQDSKISRFQIHIYPNPTSGIYNLQFTIYNLQSVSVSIYDVHGREVALVMDEKLPAGEHVVRYDMAGLPEGVYLVRAIAGDQATSEKIIKVK